MKYYGLDPCQYFSAPGLSWDAMLKMFGVELEKIDDIDKYFERFERRSFLIVCRHSEANNCYMKDYDPTKTLKIYWLFRHE